MTTYIGGFFDTLEQAAAFAAACFAKLGEINRL